MAKGVYCLVFRNPKCSIGVGALGHRDFQAGYHVYTGSALGSGGLKRVSRHIGLSRKKNRPPKWHIDYLLTSRNFDLVSVVCASTDEKIECRLAQTLGGIPVPSFGCSDCDCDSHLFYFAGNPLDDVVRVFLALDLVPVITTLITPNAQCTI
jgi:Uri superfamily endonuclease